MIHDLPAELLGRGRIHPALHVDDRGVVVGRVSAEGTVQLITSDGGLYDAQDVKSGLLFPPRPYADLTGRWDGGDVLDFRTTRNTPTFSEVLALMINALDQAMEFPRPEHGALVATWGLATYFFRGFLTFPRLNLSGERESGKSKLLMLLRAMAWNALLLLNPTPAVLFRLVHEFRPTLLLDEMEGLNREDARDVLAIINSGYKLGGSVPRCEGERTKRVELFEVYAPLALAAIRSVNATTEDRCIPIVLQRGADPRRLNAEVNPADAIFARIRAGCYQLLLTRVRDVVAAYDTVAIPAWLNGRARELWRPLLALAAVADGENGLSITPDLLTLARAHVEDRDPVSAEGEALLAILGERLGQLAEVIVRPGELTEDLRERLGWRDRPTPELAAAWLRRLGFPRAGKDRLGARYRIGADQLQQVTDRYTPQTTVTPSPSHDN